MRREPPYMKLSQALKAKLPPGFDRYELAQYYYKSSQFPGNVVSLSMLACAHLAYYKSPGLFRNDPRFPGDDQTRAERITRDLINAWPELVLRIRFIPRLARIVRKVHGLVFESRNWSLFKVITFPAIIPTLKEVGL